MITEIADTVSSRALSRERSGRVPGDANRPSLRPAVGSGERDELWLALVVAVVTAGTVAAVRWPAWAEMLIIAVGFYVMCKQVTWWTATRGGTRGVWWKQLAYLVAWPGMDARAFILRAGARRVGTREWSWAVAKLTSGAALIWVASRMMGRLGGFAGAWTGMVGLALMFHFGLFHVLELVWRSGGLNARGVMNEPWRSASVSEFWGKRWNSSYRDLTHRFVFAPLVKVMPGWAAVLLGFLCSGFVHELVISVPARAGYGLPTLYFVAQGLGVLMERSAWARRPCYAKYRGVWTWIVIAAPVVVLFHPWFVARVVLPMLGAMRAM